MQKEYKLKDTLVEVRKAYRLLYSYQKGILNLMNYIGKRFGFTFDNIEPRFSNKSNYTKLKNNAWDWLNLYCCAFHFKGQKIGEKEMWFSIFLITDTGFFDDGLYKSKEKSWILIDKLDEYKTPEKSNSKLVFVIGEHREFGVKNDEYFKAYEELLKKEEGEYEKKGKKIFYKHYLLEDFLDENGARGKLEKFVGFCKKKGIPLELKDKTV